MSLTSFNIVKILRGNYRGKKDRGVTLILLWTAEGLPGQSIKSQFKRHLSALDAILMRECWGGCANPAKRVKIALKCVYGHFVFFCVVKDNPFPESPPTKKGTALLSLLPCMVEVNQNFTLALRDPDRKSVVRERV